MQLKTTMCVALALLAVQSASAQDFIYKKNGNKEEVVIKEVGQRNITYKRFSNQSGPDYVIPRGEVTRIEYENGTEDIINGGGRERLASSTDKAPKEEVSNNNRMDYGKNIFSFSPIAMTNTSATGIGLSYERTLDKNYIASFFLPISVSFRSKSEPNNNYYYTDRGSATVLWAYPGVKIYPTGSNRRVSYAIGASIPFAVGTESNLYTNYLPNGNQVNDYRETNIFMMGAMITNYLNIQPSRKVFLGLQLGLGIPYIKNSSDDGPDYRYRYYSPDNMEPWVDFSFRIGYRF